MLKISENSLVLRTREFTDIFITFDEIYLIFTSKNVIIIYVLGLTVLLDGISVCIRPSPGEWEKEEGNIDERKKCPNNLHLLQDL